MLRTIAIDLLYQDEIPGPPIQDLYGKAAAGDKNTIEHWRDKWIENYRSAKDHFGSFGDKSFGQLHGVNRHKPCIVIGSGPSLETSIGALKKNKEEEVPVTSISALHNFGYLDDEGCHADYYLSLDSGAIVLEDVSESRKHDKDYYWAQTKGKTLLAYVSSDPKLWELWQGDVYLFNTLIPSPDIRKKKNEVEKFTHYISSGGNAGGACVYVAKALFGSAALMLVGLDYCFSYSDKFHAYDTHYDAVGEYVRWPDVYGNLRKTWRSYLNFKFWLDDRVCKVPGEFYNCSEGILGAYKEGNIRQYRYMPLNDALIQFHSADRVYLEERKEGDPTYSKRERFALKDFWSNPQSDLDITLF